jgi:hypothetical protein
MRARAGATDDANREQSLFSRRLRQPAAPCSCISNDRLACHVVSVNRAVVLLAYGDIISPSTVRPSDIPTHRVVTLALAAYTSSERYAEPGRYVQHGRTTAAVESVTRSFAAVRSTRAT